MHKLQRQFAVSQRTITFLMWSANHKSFDLTSSTFFEWMQRVVKKEFYLLDKFCEHLETEKDFKASTVKGWLYDIQLALQWFTFFSEERGDISADLFEPVRRTIKNINRQLSKAEKSDKSNRTLESEILARRIAPGGTGSLQKVIEARMPWARSLTEGDFRDQVVFREFSKLMFSSFYTDANNGRGGGIESLNFAEGDLLARNDYVMSKKFKTGKKFGYQPVKVKGNCKELFHIYWNIARVEIATKCAGLMNESDPLFVDFNGKASTSLSRAVTSFFKTYCGLHLTATSLRSMVEMESHKMFHDGIISARELEAVAHSSGHSSRTVQDFYQLEDREADRRDSNAMFERLNREAPTSCALESVRALNNESLRTNTLNSTSPSTSIFQSNRTIHWGSLHDTGEKLSDKPTLRVLWSSGELNYIGAIVKEYTDRRGTVPRNICHIILQRIIADSNAHPIFHPHHTLDTSRIRNGYNSYIKREKRKREEEEMEEGEDDEEGKEDEGEEE